MKSFLEFSEQNASIAERPTSVKQALDPEISMTGLGRLRFSQLKKNVEQNHDQMAKLLQRGNYESYQNMQNRITRDINMIKEIEKEMSSPQYKRMVTNLKRKGMMENDDYEYDYEGSMVKTQLNTISDAAYELYSMILDNQNIPEWVQGKITKAADYIDTARDYMKNKVR